MKKIILYILFGSLFLFLQVSTLVNRYIGIKGIVPDFLLVYIIIISYLSDSFEGETIGFILGLILDYFSSSLFGLSSFIYVVFGFFIGELKKQINIESIFFILILVLLSSLVKLFFYYFFGYMFKEIFITFKNTIVYFSINLVYTLFVTPFIYYILNAVFIKTNILNKSYK